MCVRVWFSIYIHQINCNGHTLNMQSNVNSRFDGWWNMCLRHWRSSFFALRWSLYVHCTYVRLPFDNGELLLFMAALLLSSTHVSAYAVASTVLEKEQRMLRVDFMSRASRRMQSTADASLWHLSTWRLAYTLCEHINLWFTFTWFCCFYCCCCCSTAFKRSVPRILIIAQGR